MNPSRAPWGPGASAPGRVALAERGAERAAGRWLLWSVVSLVWVTGSGRSVQAADPRENPWWKEGRSAVERAAADVGAIHRARNVILFVGDGMGITTVTAARILEGQRRGESGEENQLSFETLPFTALSKTYNVDFQVPDSAGTMSAMVTGVKTRMGVLSVDETVARGDFAGAAGASVPTILEQAEDRGMWTGVVTTTTVTHATPGACYAHTPERNWEVDAKLSPAAREAGFKDIARQLVEFEHGDGPEVVLGGGRAFFLPAASAAPADAAVPTPAGAAAPLASPVSAAGARLDGRDLVARWRSLSPGRAYATTRGELEGIDGRATDKLLGLFDLGHMPYEIDRDHGPNGSPSLADMTVKALDVLQRAPKGYFLMVEGGRIDHGHHAGNAARALTEVIEFAKAVRVALDRTSAADTLIVVTADHSHTLSMAGYARRGNPILGLVIGSNGEEKPSDLPATDATGRPYTTLSYANGPGYAGRSDLQPEGPKKFPHKTKSFSPATQGRPDLAAVDTRADSYMQEALAPLESETHGGEDVPIYARGPGAAVFHGTQEQNFIYHAMVHALGWDSAAPPERGR